MEGRRLTAENWLTWFWGQLDKPGVHGADWQEGKLELSGAGLGWAEAGLGLKVQSTGRCSLPEEGAWALGPFNEWDQDYHPYSE